MIKDNEKEITYDLSEETSLKLIKEGFKLLPANRAVNYRKKLYVHLNKIVKPKVQELTWKKRFITPEKSISKNQKSELIPIMVESVMFLVQMYVDDCINQIALLENSLKSMEEILKIYRNE